MTITKQDSKETTKLCLILEVEYDNNGVDRNTLQRMLIDIAEDAMDEGVVTGETPAEVKNWRVYVSPFTRNFQDVVLKKREKEDDKETEKVA